MVAELAPLQVGFGLVGLLFFFVLAAGVLLVVGLVLWGLYALFRSVASSEPSRTAEWRRLLDHPAIEETGRYGGDPPEVETTVGGRRVVARVETAPGGTDQYAVLQTPTMAVKAGTGFELAGDRGGVEFVDRGPETPALPESLWTDLERLPTFGGLTVDDRTGVVEHRFPDPAAVTNPETLREHAEALVGVAEVVEEYAEASRSGTDAGEEAGTTGADTETGDDRETAVERSGGD